MFRGEIWNEMMILGPQAVKRVKVKYGVRTRYRGVSSTGFIGDSIREQLCGMHRMFFSSVPTLLCCHNVTLEVEDGREENERMSKTKILE